MYIFNHIYKYRLQKFLKYFALKKFDGNLRVNYKFFLRDLTTKKKKLLNLN
jgi:hypothetical protein